MIRERHVYNAEAPKSSCKSDRRCLLILDLKMLRVSEDDKEFQWIDVHAKKHCCNGELLRMSDLDNQ